MNTSRGTRKTACTLAVIATSLLIAACGSKTTSTSVGAVGSTSGGSQPKCSLAPESLVNSVLATSFGAPEENDVDNVTVCSYSANGGTSNGIIRFETKSTSLDTAKTGFTSTNQSTVDYPGLGDEAFTSTMGGTGIVPVQNTVVARKGSTAVLITSPATIDAEVNLMRQLFTKL